MIHISMTNIHGRCLSISKTIHIFHTINQYSKTHQQQYAFPASASPLPNKQASHANQYSHPRPLSKLSMEFSTIRINSLTRLCPPSNYKLNLSIDLASHKGMKMSYRFIQEGIVAEFATHGT